MEKANEMAELEWWEMLDWNQMENTWKMLSDEFKDKIRRAGLAPQGEREGSQPAGHFDRL